jgi:hypothetical protein
MPEAPVPRRHHFVPKFLLAGFTPAGSVDELLWVHDARTSSAPRQARPSSIAFENDFYRVDVGDDPVAVERLLGEFETKAAPIVREIADTWDVPSEKRLNDLLRFVALLVVRGPRHRRWLSDTAHEFARFYLDVATRTPELYAAQYEKVRTSGVVDLPPPNWEGMRKLLKPGACRFNVNRTWLVGQSLKQAEEVLQWLTPRRWGLVVAAGDAPNFVCCDSPVSLSPRNERPLGIGVGWATPHTTAFIPLTRRVLLVGSLDEPATRRLIVRKPRIIAELNAFTVMNASRWVYTTNEDFVWRRPDNGAMGHASDFREVVEEMAAQRCA